MGPRIEQGFRGNNNDEASDPQDRGSGSVAVADNRGTFMGDVLDRMKHRMEERQERRRERWNPTPPTPVPPVEKPVQTQPQPPMRMEGQPPQVERKGSPGDKPPQTTPQSSNSLDHHNGVAKMTVPRGFKLAPEDKDSPVFHSVHSPDSFRAFQGPDANTKICYWKLDAYAPGEKSSAALAALLTPGRNNPPHKLSKEETDAVAEAIPNGLYGYNGNFDILQLRTADVNGKRVLVMETKFKDADRNTIGIFANPDRAKGSIELLWFEAPRDQYQKNFKEAWTSIATTQFEGTAQPARQPLFRRLRDR